jgi:zinc protease
MPFNTECRSNPSLRLGRWRLTALAALWLLVPFSWVQAQPVIEHWETGNGARVYFAAAPELPMVDVRVIFDAGSARDAGKAGLAQLTAALLTDGAGELGADEIAERFADLGARFGAGARRDSASVSLRSLTDPELLEPALDLAALVLREPTFQPDGFERDRRRMLVSVRLGEQSPGYLLGRAFYEGLYGEHPYGSPPGGTQESLEALTREDVVEFHQQYYTASNAVVAIVGDLDRAGAEVLAERLLGQLPPGDPVPELPPPPPLQDAGSIHVMHPSAQSHVQMGQLGIARNDPDYFPLIVGNHVLGGGGMVSRLFHEIRERRGLSYSVYSYFQPMQERGPFVMGLQTEAEQAEEASRLLAESLRQFVTEGPSEEELTAAKQNLTGGFALRLDSNSAIVEQLAAIGYYRLPLDYLDRYIESVEAVTLEQVQDAFRRHLDPERLLTISVGQVPAVAAAE